MRSFDSKLTFLKNSPGVVGVGVDVGLNNSVKWVGLFTIATIGLCVLKYLQESRTHLYISTVRKQERKSRSATIIDVFYIRLEADLDCLLFLLLCLSIE